LRVSRRPSAQPGHDRKPGNCPLPLTGQGTFSYLGTEKEISLMRKLLKVIDTISEWSGRLGRWFTLFLVLVMVYEVISRYAFHRPTMWAYETSIMLGCALYALGYSYVQCHRAHVRVDVFYIRLSSRGKAIIDVIGGVIFFLPLIIMLTDTSWLWMIKAWKIKEKMFETYWFPPAYPLRTAVALGFALLAMQGLAQLFRDFYQLIRNKAYD